MANLPAKADFLKSNGLFPAMVNRLLNLQFTQSHRTDSNLHMPVQTRVLPRLHQQHLASSKQHMPNMPQSALLPRTQSSIRSPTKPLAARKHTAITTTTPENPHALEDTTPYIRHETLRGGVYTPNLPISLRPTHRHYISDSVQDGDADNMNQHLNRYTRWRTLLPLQSFRRPIFSTSTSTPHSHRPCHIDPHILVTQLLNGNFNEYYYHNDENPLRQPVQCPREPSSRTPHPHHL
ncbi:hypothetical protein BST61_g8545 [Cercospora zeina]